MIENIMTYKKIGEYFTWFTKRKQKKKKLGLHSDTVFSVMKDAVVYILNQITLIVTLCSQNYQMKHSRFAKKSCASNYIVKM